MNWTKLARIGLSEQESRLNESELDQVELDSYSDDT